MKKTQVSELAIRKDIHDMDKRIERKLRHIRNELSPENIKIIEEYYDAMKLETCGKVVQDKHLQCLYKMSLELGKNWHDADKKDVNRIVLWIIDKYTDVKGQETHASSDYKKVLKIFFRWMKKGYRKKDPNELDPEEIRKITIKRVKNRLSREDLITEDDRTKLLHACGDNQRDRAFIDTLIDSGARPTEHLTLQIKHVGQDKFGFFFKVDGKTTSRPIRLIRSSPSLASWLNVHPFRNNPEAPLWPSFSKSTYGNQITYKTVRQILEKRSERAGLNKRFYMYLCRHSEITNAANYLTEGQLRKRHGWTAGSKSPEIYTHLIQADVDDAILNHYGLKKEAQEAKTPKTCSICEMPNEPDADLCSKCGKALSLEAAIAAEEKEQENNQKLLDKIEKIESERQKDREFMLDYFDSQMKKMRETGYVPR